MYVTALQMSAQHEPLTPRGQVLLGLITEIHHTVPGMEQAEIPALWLRWLHMEMIHESCRQYQFLINRRRW